MDICVPIATAGTKAPCGGGKGKAAAGPTGSAGAAPRWGTRITAA
jgi:hypothetical protein